MEEAAKPTPEAVPEGLEIRTYFVRHRNALLARAEFSELYVDYYLHLAANDIQYPGAQDRLFKETLSALTLHCASRPHNETIAWTVNFQNPLVNIFVTGDNETGGVAGQVFNQNVKQTDHNFLFSDVVRGTEPARRSVIEFEGRDVFRAVEKYYLQSEQRPARFFQFAEEDYVMISAQPDCDTDWLNSLTVEDIRVLDQKEQLSLLEQRRYRWHCGCDEQRMLSLLAPVMQRDPDELFGDDPSIRISCPRCGARYTITKETMEAYLAEKK
ncbi:MAG: Hsp33 family molecular chaperone HslO [Verrucomicrobiales bacterium]|jgi:molecular chaperone Hsp33|nr:Hsp33 family molecular chaperone HslO [Verrucomicrobiales bacterium]